MLVVDDDPSLRLLCRVNLELEGYAVIEAETLDAAERALDDGVVDVVLLDVHLGNEEGLPPDATVIPKPFRIDDLTGTVRRLAAS